MSWGEAFRLTERLFLDPSSHVAAAVCEWAHPVTWDAIVAMNDYDLKHQIAWVQGGKKGPRPEPYVRPWPDKVRKHLTPGKSLTQDEVLAALRAAGHDGEVPSR